MKNQFFFKQLIAIAALMMLTFSCNNDDDFTEPPVIKGAQQLKDTLTIGKTLQLSSKLADRKNVSFEWAVDGKVVGSDSTYIFKPETRGDFKITMTAKNDGGKVSLTYDIHAWGAYENGFFMINEGWFGHGTGTVGFYRYDTRAIEDSVFVKVNPDKDLKPASSTLEFGTIINKKLFLVSKVGGPVVVADAYTLKEEKRIAAKGGNDWRAVVGIDENQALLTSGKGIFKLNLNTMEVNGQIEGVTGQVGDIVKANGYIFALSASKGIIVINASTLAVEKTIPGMVLGFAVTDDKKVWAAGGKNLISIDSNTLEVKEIALGFQAYGSWGAWHPGSITAAKNDVFIAKNGSFSGGKEIYKYTGTPESLATPFITLTNSNILYGAGIGYDRKKNALVVNTLNSGFGVNFSINNLYLFNADSGEKTASVNFSGYYFPAVSVFHQ
ncbi:DUF5074 domain-containing protein [Flavobacterium hydatis]|uniref:PKD domain-containing protein n=1 Tax=Flavobacterium hydatis TaxID=991 RepID=A0A086AHU3_FLAHY|nr:DUF5074 domain-containing protein [Flavobacterium hydatis]KFF16257.1 hypothetical protein IW20_10860 [Flavobacterium hydatis]OXA96722.1 hypothetical protein B0A62_05550 [Flavobacterium hydatis]